MSVKQTILNILSGIITTILLMLLVFALTLVSFNVVYYSTPVVGFSMRPTLNSTVERDDIDGDIAYVNRFKKYKKNDIVVANVNWYDRGPIIKRVIAMEGDVVELILKDDKYQLVVNNDCVATKQKNENTDKFYEKYTNFINNNLFVDTSKNVRDNKIVVNKNELLLIGDNWGVSLDCMSNGVVSTNCIQGKVDFVVPYKQNKYDYVLKQMFKALFWKNN